MQWGGMAAAVILTLDSGRQAQGGCRSGGAGAGGEWRGTGRRRSAHEVSS